MKKVLFILSELIDADIEWIVAAGRRETVTQGTVLIQEGQLVDTLYILLDGELVVSTLAVGEREIARLGSGEVVGEMSFVDARPPSATVTAWEDAVVFAIPRLQLAEQLQQDNGFAARFYRALATFLSYRLRTTVSQLGYSQAQANEPSMVADGNSQAAELRLENLLTRLRQANPA